GEAPPALSGGRGGGGAARAGRPRRSRADPMRGLAHLKRSTMVSKAWMPNARPQCRCQAPQPRSGAPLGAGLDTGTPDAAQSALAVDRAPLQCTAADDFAPRPPYPWRFSFNAESPPA